MCVAAVAVRSISKECWSPVNETQVAVYLFLCDAANEGRTVSKSFPSDFTA